MADFFIFLVDSEEYEHASSLGEKFHDFEILVSICEKTNNREKLYQYMNKFENYVSFGSFIIICNYLSDHKYLYIF